MMYGQVYTHPYGAIKEDSFQGFSFLEPLSLFASATVVAIFSIGINFVFALTGQATAAAALTNAIRIKQAMTGNAAVGPVLTTAIPLSAVMSGGATVEATLTTLPQAAAAGVAYAKTVLAPTGSRTRVSNAAKTRY